MSAPSAASLFPAPASPSAVPERVKGERQARLVGFGSLVAEVVESATQAHQTRLTGIPHSPVTGWKKLDDRIGGGLPPLGTSVVLGNTGAGKTAFCLQMAAQCAFPALYVTTEMAPAELFRRQIARVSGQFLGRLKSGETPPAEVERLARQTAQALPNLFFVDATQGPATLSFLADCAEVVRAARRPAFGEANGATNGATEGTSAAPNKILVVVDSLHSWVRGIGSGAPEYEALNAGLSGLQSLSHSIGAPVVAICEQNRAGMDAGGVNSGAGSRFIEYGAEIVFDLQAAKETDALGELPVTVRLAKNRHGAAGAKVPFLFNGALQRFREAS